MTTPHRCSPRKIAALQACGPSVPTCTLPASFAPTLSGYVAASQRRGPRVAGVFGAGWPWRCGLGPLNRFCPDCGRDHAHGRVLRCQGRPVCDVVCIAPGYRVPPRCAACRFRGASVIIRLRFLAYLLTHREPML